MMGQEVGSEVELESQVLQAERRMRPKRRQKVHQFNINARNRQTL